MLSAIGEILSSAAVFVTLVFLAMQTRQSANATQSNTRQAILAADQQLLQLIVDNPDLYLVRFKPRLTDEEKVRLGAYLVTFVRMRENNWLQYQNGVLDEGSVPIANPSCRFGAPNPDLWQNYARDTGAFDVGFIALVDEPLATRPQEQPLAIGS
jgi:hypothetical protein